jgi:hypothetical protein
MIHLYSLLAVLLTFLNGCGEEATNSYKTAAAPAPGRAVRVSSMEQYFRPVKTIPLSDSLLLGSVTSLEIASQDRLLVTDLTGKKVVLFNAEGKLIRGLNPAACHPRFNWSPHHTALLPEHKILVINSGDPWRYKFDEDGNYMHEMDRRLSFSNHVASDTNQYLYGLYTGPDRYYI